MYFASLKGEAAFSMSCLAALCGCCGVTLNVCFSSAIAAMAPELDGCPCAEWLGRLGSTAHFPRRATDNPEST